MQFLVLFRRKWPLTLLYRPPFILKLETPTFFGHHFFISFFLFHFPVHFIVFIVYSILPFSFLLFSHTKKDQVHKREKKKKHSILAQHPCTASLHSILAQHPCTASLHSILAQHPCTASILAQHPSLHSIHPCTASLHSIHPCRYLRCTGCLKTHCTKLSRNPPELDFEKVQGKVDVACPDGQPEQ